MLRSWDFLDHGDERINPILRHAEQGPVNSSLSVNSEQLTVNSSLRVDKQSQMCDSTDKNCSRFTGYCSLKRKAAFTLAEGATHVAKSAKPRRAAFTLAEVLITLGIIGVVAAMTLPGLIQNYQKQVILTQLKKNYAILNQAVQMMRADNDGVEPIQISSFMKKQYNGSPYIDYTLFGPEFAKYLPTDWHKVDSEKLFCYKDADSFDAKWAFAGKVSALYFTKFTYYVWHLTNGACVQLGHTDGWSWRTASNQQYIFIVDVNGSDKRPNRVGLDIFMFEFMPDGRILPVGHDKSASELKNDWSRCNNTGAYCIYEIVNNGWQFPKNYPLKW